jgi:hypothetical protein
MYYTSLYDVRKPKTYKRDRVCLLMIPHFSVRKSTEGFWRNLLLENLTKYCRSIWSFNYRFHRSYSFIRKCHANITCENCVCIPVQIARFQSCYFRNTDGIEFNQVESDSAAHCISRLSVPLDSCKMTQAYMNSLQNKWVCFCGIARSQNQFDWTGVCAVSVSEA